MFYLIIHHFKKRVLYTAIACVFLHSVSLAQEQISTYTKDDGLTSFVITCTYVDAKGIVWLGTNNGLNAYASGKWYAITSIEDSKTGKPEPMGRVETIFEDSQGNIWVSVLNKIFLYRNKFWTVFSEPDIDDYVVKNFYEDSRGWVWATLEHFQDFKHVSEITFNLLGGTLHMYNGLRWYKFDDDVAGNIAIDPSEPPQYFTSFFQDKEGNIWVSSLKGVYMFNGKKWVTYDEKDLVSEKVRKLIMDKNGTVWAATDYGISYKHGDEWIDLTKKDGLCGTGVYDIREDPQGRIWAFTRNHLRFAGVSMVEYGKCTPFDKHKTKLKGSIEQIVWYGGSVMAMARDGVSVFDSAGRWHEFDNRNGLHDTRYYFLVKDMWERIWLAGDRSLYAFQEEKWTQLKEQEEWKVSALYVSRKGDVWLGTEKKGVFRYREGQWLHYTQESGLTENYVAKIFEDNKSNIWVITRKGVNRIEASP